MGRELSPLHQDLMLSSAFTCQNPPSSGFYRRRMKLASFPTSKIQVHGNTRCADHGAALLLLKVRRIANDEVCTSPSVAPCLLVPLPGIESPRESSTACSSEVASDASRPDSSDADTMRPSSGSPSMLRCRTVSMGSLDFRDGGTVSPSGIESLPHSRPLQSVTSENSDGISGDFKKFVGTTIDGPVQGVLRKKFSWKTFPELEDYLVNHRHQYLQFSSTLNYTAEQKLYNNRLTQGLLDLARDNGYIFEDFTFAMIRDRIRCYYKSYVQAVKKKKRKKRR